MSISPVDLERRIVPRWRDIRTTARLGELQPIGPASAPALSDSQGALTDKLAVWKAEHSTGAAAELVATAAILNRDEEARDAAEFLLRPDSDAGDVVKRLAAKVLGQPIDTIVAVTADDRIRRLRSRLALQPRNAIAWVELSREYAIRGRSERALRAMRTAVGLVDGNRFVLRSATRLLVHSKSADEADHMLLGREATKHDPWLLAAQIAVASVVGYRSPLLKRAKAIVADQRFSPKHLTELASALATVEFENGSLVGSRRLFRQSLIDPTENSVAQADWAARRMEGLGVPSAALEQSHTFEARTWRLFAETHWQEGLAACDDWLADEPFSSRPAMIGSYHALVAAHDYHRAEKFALEGLQSNPKHPGLLNNLAVALADQGKLDEAERALSRAHDDLVERDLIARTATAGLIRFRRGQHEAGRALYRDAIDRARRDNDEYMRVLALAHLAREEAIAGTPEAEATWLELPKRARVEKEFPDVATFIRQVASLHELREKHANL